MHREHDPQAMSGKAEAQQLERRRQLLQLAGASLGAAALSAALPSTARATQAPAAALKTPARVLIVGSGLGGLAVANRLSRQLQGARITIVDAKLEHNYQPGYTLVASGVWTADKVRNRNAELIPAGVEWVQEMAAAFEPDANVLVTSSGKRIAYDVLVVATGTHMDYGQIEGMDVSAIGKAPGLTSVYPGPQAAEDTWRAMQAFAAKGGQALMTLPATPLKCAGAPLKMSFMLRDRLHRAGTLQRSEIHFMSSLGTVFGVPKLNEQILQRWQTLGIAPEFNQRLVAVDIAAQRARFRSPEGEEIEKPYDFLHVVPPMRAPDVVKNSPLAWQEGPFAAGGWLEVDKNSLQHRRYPNVFGIGDINGTPRGKTAATVKKSAPLVANNIVQLLAGQALDDSFDGYTSCPLITREGSALLVEFDYEGRLTPSLPMIDPLQDSYFAWLMKLRLLKPAYMAVAKGRV